MEISEVRVKLVANQDDRLKAFCSMTLDNEFVVRDIKIIEGAGGLFVAMPSRKMSDHCSKCGGKNHLRAKFCNHCGGKLPENRARQDMDGRMKLHADIAHPINASCRKKIQETIVLAFHEEVEKSKQPGYKPVEMDTPDD
ncbi:MAG: SpoVG family protein [Anaerohalosphaeraceae bacterium]